MLTKHALFMLSKQHRLPLFNHETKEKIHLPHVKNGTWIKIRFKKRKPTKTKNRFGIIVSSKVAPQATRRNRIKRIIYGTVQKDKNLTAKKEGIDTLIVVKKAPTNKKQEQELKKETSFLLKEILDS